MQNKTHVNQEICIQTRADCATDDRFDISYLTVYSCHSPPVNCDVSVNNKVKVVVVAVVVVVVVVVVDIRSRHLMTSCSLQSPQPASTVLDASTLVYSLDQRDKHASFCLVNIFRY